MAKGYTGYTTGTAPIWGLNNALKLTRQRYNAMTTNANKKKEKQKVLVVHLIIISSIFMHLLLKLFFLFLNFCQFVSENSQIFDKCLFTKFLLSYSPINLRQINC